MASRWGGCPPCQALPLPDHLSLCINKSPCSHHLSLCPCYPLTWNFPSFVEKLVPISKSLSTPNVSSFLATSSRWRAHSTSWSLSFLTSPGNSTSSSRLHSHTLHLYHYQKLSCLQNFECQHSCFITNLLCLLVNSSLFIP